MSKKKNQQNFYDHFIEDLAHRFSQIPNFNLTQEDELGKKQFNFISRRFTEVHSIKTLFLNYYIPASTKAVSDDLNQINKSKYKHLLVISREELKENYYETVRLGYVAVFHKIESFVNECIEMAEEVAFDPDIKSSTPLLKYAEKQLDFKIKNWRMFPTIERINWVCNCVKHYDGYPVKTPKPLAYRHLAEDSKIKLSKDDFKRDVDGLDEIYQSYLQLIYTLAMYKMFKEGSTADEIVGTKESDNLDEHIAKLIAIFKQ